MTLLIVPPRIRLPRAPFHRQHRPRRLAFERYVSCLRWEFGFTCAMCLLHETDYESAGVMRRALYMVEHLESRKMPQDRDDYEHVVWTCRRCHRHRDSRLDLRGHSTILNPTAVAWSKHFRIRGDRIIPRADDADAQHTHEAYDIDAVDKVRLRSRRRRLLTACLALVTRRGLAVRDALNEQARLPGSGREDALQRARVMQQAWSQAVTILLAHPFIPVDRPSQCADRPKRWVWLHVLPGELARQAIDVPADVFEP